MIECNLAIRVLDHNLILWSNAEYALIMIHYHLAITIDGKPETGGVPGYQSHYLSLYYTLSGENNLIKCRFIAQ